MPHAGHRSCSVSSAGGCAGSFWPENQANPCGLQGAYRLAILTKDMHRQVTRESRTDANSPWRMAMSSDLTELGQEAIAGLQRGGMSRKRPVIQCRPVAPVPIACVLYSRA